MRRLTLFTSICLLWLGSHTVRGQVDSVDAQVPGKVMRLETRIGIMRDGVSVGAELQSYISRSFSLDCGFRPTPLSLYGGVSWYIFSGFFTQVQGGFMDHQIPPDPDAPAFESEAYGMFRLGFTGQDRSRMGFSLSIGALWLFDFDYCYRCPGNSFPTQDVPLRRVEQDWSPIIEAGIYTPL